MKTHYDTLGVSKNATRAEIKEAFRKLSLETHPDVSPQKCATKFKQISQAHDILSNDVKRRLYDEEIFDPIRNELRKHRGGRNASSGAAANTAHRHSASFMHNNLFQGMFARPQTIALGLGIGITTMVVLRFALGNNNNNHDASQPALVEAWFNPNSQQWEPPAPWNPTYKRLRPELKLVPRQNVRHEER